MNEPATPSFFGSLREKNPHLEGVSDDDLFYKAVDDNRSSNPERIEEWKNKFPDFKERYDAFLNPTPQVSTTEDRGVGDWVGQHTRAVGSGLGGSLWRGVEGVAQASDNGFLKYLPATLVARELPKKLLGDDNLISRFQDKSRQAIADFAGGAADVSDKAYGVREETTQKFTGQLAHGAGQLLGQIGTSIVNPALGIANMGGQMYSEAVSDAEDTFGKSYKDFTPEEKKKTDTVAGLYGVAGAALERLGLGAIAGNIIRRGAGEATETVVKRLTLGAYGKKIAGAFLAEGSTEAMQGQLLDTLAKSFYDDDRELWTEDTVKKRLTEFTLGGILGGGAKNFDILFEYAGRTPEEGDPDPTTPQTDPVDPYSAADEGLSESEAAARETARQAVYTAGLNNATETVVAFEKIFAEDPTKLGDTLWKQAVPVGEKSHVENLEAIKAEFPELAQRVDDLLDTQPTPDQEQEVEGTPAPEGTDTQDTASQERVIEAEPEVFGPGTRVQWDLKRGNEFVTRRGEVTGMSTSTTGEQVYEVKMPDGSTNKVLRGAVVEDTAEVAAEQEVVEDTAPEPTSAATEEVLYKHFGKNPKLLAFVQGEIAGGTEAGLQISERIEQGWGTKALQGFASAVEGAPQQGKTPARAKPKPAQPKGGKLMVRIHSALAKDSSLRDYIVGRIKAGELGEFKELIEDGLSLSAIRLRAEEEARDAGFLKDPEPVEKPNALATPTSEQKPSTKPKGNPRLSDENAKVMGDVFSKNPGVSLTKAAKLFKEHPDSDGKGMRTELVQQLYDKALRDGHLVPDYTTEFPAPIYKGETFETVREFVNDGGLKRWGDKKGNTHRSKQLIALKLPTGEVMVRPIVQDNGGGYEILKVSHKKKGEGSLDVFGNQSAPLHALPEGGQVLLLFRYEGEPTRDGFTFKSEKAFDQAFFAAETVAAEADGTTQNIAGESSQTANKASTYLDEWKRQVAASEDSDAYGNRDDEVNDDDSSAPVVDSSAVVDPRANARVDTEEDIARQRLREKRERYVAIKKKIDEAGIKEGEIHSEEHRGFWDALPEVKQGTKDELRRRLRGGEVSRADAQMLAVGNTEAQVNVLEPIRKQVVESIYEDAHQADAGDRAGDPGRSRGPSVPRSNGSPRANRPSSRGADGNSGRASQPADRAGDTRSAGRDVANGNQKNRSRPDGLAPAVSTARRADPLAKPNAPKAAEGGSSGANVSASSGEGRVSEERGDRRGQGGADAGTTKPVKKAAAKRVDKDASAKALLKKIADLPNFLKKEKVAHEKANGRNSYLVDDREISLVKFFDNLLNKGQLDSGLPAQVYALLYDTAARQATSAANMALAFDKSIKDAVTNGAFRQSLSNEPDANWTGVDSLDIIGGDAAKTIYQANPQSSSSNARVSPEAARRLYQAASVARGARASRLRSSESTPSIAPRLSGGRVDPQQRVEQETVLRAWAEENGMLLGRDFYDEFVEKIDALEDAGSNASGGEADVYYVLNEDRWIKMHESLISHQFESHSGFLDRLLLHNELFPETAYTLEGFAEAPNGRLVPIISQPHVEVKVDEFGNPVAASEAQVDELMEGLGFEKRGSDSYVRGNIEVKDLHKENVLVDADGKFQVIDPIIHANSVIEDAELSVSNETNKRITPLTENATKVWNNTMNVLRHAGVDVELVERDMGSDNDFFKKQNARYSRKKQLIQVVMNDVTDPSPRNLRALLHEAAHAVVGNEAPGMVRAIDALAADLLAGRENITAEHLKNEQEATVELLAMRLQDEGFGARSTNIAARLVRYLKDLYYRAGLAIHRALHGEVNGNMALSYAENRMKQFLSGDGDVLPSFLEHIGGPAPSKMMVLAGSSTHVHGSPSEVEVNPDGSLVFPDHLPTGDAIVESGMFSLAKDAQNQIEFLAKWAQEQGVTLDEMVADKPTFDRAAEVWRATHPVEELMDHTEFAYSLSKEPAQPRGETATYRPPHVSRAWIAHAAKLELELIIQDLVRETNLPREQIEKVFKTKNPHEDAKKIEELVPSSAQATLATLTPAERAKALQQVRKDAGRFAHEVHLKVIRSDESSKAAAKTLEREQKYVDDLQKDPANAALLNEDLRLSMRKKFKQYRKQAEQTGKDFKLDGTIGETMREKGEISDNPLDMHKRMVDTFQKLSGDTAKPFRFAQALASLGLDFHYKGDSLSTILAEIAGYKNNAAFKALSPQQQMEVGSALDTLNNDTALRAVMIDFARGNSLRMDTLEMRLNSEVNRYSDLNRLVVDIQTASDERIRELELEVREVVGKLTAKDRLKRSIVKHNAHIRKQQKIIDTNKEVMGTAASVLPHLSKHTQRVGAEQGEVSYFEGGAGALVVVMDPKKGGEITDKLPYENWTTERARFNEAIHRNQEWMRLNPDQKGTPIYQSVEQTTDRIKKDLAHKDSTAVRYNIFMRKLQPLVKLLKNIGLAETKAAASSIYTFQSTAKELETRLHKSSRKWEVAYGNVLKAAGFEGLPGEFNDKVRHLVLYSLEKESGIQRDTDAVNFAYQKIVDYLNNVGAPKKVNGKKLLAAVDKWVRVERRHGELLDSLREEAGVPIEDAETWAVDPVTGKQRKAMRLKGVKQGWLTVPRSLKMEIFVQSHKILNRLNWYGDLSDQPKPAFAIGKDEPAYWQVEGATVAQTQAIVEQVSKDFAPALADPYLAENFFEPFLTNDESNFKGATAEEVAYAWDQAQGDMGLFVVQLADVTGKDILEVAGNVIETFRGKAGFFRNVSGRTANKSEENGLSHKNFIIDSRTDSTLPAHFFGYATFDQQSSVIHASRLSVAKHFGRGGNRLMSLFAQAEARLETKAGLIQSSDPKEANKLRQDLGELKRIQEELGLYFNHRDSGPYQDERVVNELVGALVGNVLNNPKTSLTQFITPLIGPAITHKGANLLTLGAAAGNIKRSVGQFAQSVLQGLGVHFDLMSEYEHDIGLLVGDFNEAGMSRAEQWTVLGKGGQFEEGGGGRALQAIRKGRRILDSQIGAKGAGTRTPLRNPFGVFKMGSAIANWATAVGQLRMVSKISDNVAKYMDTYGEWDNPNFDPSDKRVLKKMLGMGHTLNPIFGKADTYKEVFEQIEDRFEMSFADFVRQQRQRKMEGKRVFNMNDLSAIAQIAEDEISMNAGLNSRPTWFFGKAKPFVMLWGWPVMQTERVARMMTNSKGEFALQKTGKGSSFNPRNYELDKAILLKMAMTMGLFAMPASLAYSLMLDLYDEFFRGRAPNLRKPSMDKSLKDNTLTVVERLARMGTFGMAGDVGNSFVNWSEYNGRGANPASLDDRILVMSSVHNMINAIRNATMQGDASYATVGRPFINSVGGSGFLQYVQLFNETKRKLGAEDALNGGILKAESKFTKRSNVYNIVRAAAREAELPLNQGGGFALPSDRSMHMREMQFAALSNDSEAFAEHYRDAVEAYMGDEELPRSYDEAVSAVKSSWAYRHPLRTLFKKKLDARQIALLYSKMPEGNREDVQQAVMLHELYGNLLGN